MIDVQWTPSPLPAAALEVLRSELAAWEGAQWMPGQQCRGVAADCVHFVAAIVDRMFDRPTYTTLPRVAQDASLHDGRLTMTTVREMLRRVGPAMRIRGAAVQPGDVLVAGPEEGGPGHALIVGPDPCTIWHCARGRGVVRTGVVIPGFRLMRIYRPDIGGTR